MRWPWQREIDETKAEAAEAITAAQSEAERAKAARVQTAEQLRDVEKKMHESLETVSKLRYHLEKNGWTELLQEAWGGR